MEFLASNTKKLAVKLARACIKHNNINAAAEACAMLTALFCRLIADDEDGVEVEELFAQMCQHGFELDQDAATRIDTRTIH